LIISTLIFRHHHNTTTLYLARDHNDWNPELERRRKKCTVAKLWLLKKSGVKRKASEWGKRKQEEKTTAAAASVLLRFFIQWSGESKSCVFSHCFQEFFWQNMDCCAGVEVENKLCR
jgi:hypothetical protein